MSDEEGSRADRLRSRRSSRADRAETDVESERSERAERPDPSKPSKPTVKEEQVGTYMYLLESQKKEIDRLYNVLKAEYEFEYDHELEKNRHFYPLLVQYGFESLEGLDASEIQDRLESL